jgi:hypothetical protein
VGCTIGHLRVFLLLFYPRRLCCSKKLINCCCNLLGLFTVYDMHIVGFHHWSGEVGVVFWTHLSADPHGCTLTYEAMLLDLAPSSTSYILLNVGFGSGRKDGDENLALFA